MQQTCPNEEEDPHGAMQKTPPPSGSAVNGPRVIADLQISAHVAATDGRARMPHLRVEGPQELHEVFVAVGRAPFCTVYAQKREYVPDWLDRIVNDGRPAESFQHLDVWDTERADNQQVAGKLAAILWLQRKDRAWDCSIRACSTVDNVNNTKHLMSSDGKTGWQVIPNDRWQRVPHGAFLHFVPRAHPTAGQSMQPYRVFQFVLTVSAPVVSIPRQGNQQPHAIRLVMPDQYVRRIIGVQGDTVQTARLDTSCSITVSEWGDYHPMASALKGRVIEFEGVSRAITRNGVMKIIDAAVRTVENQPEKLGLDLRKAGVVLAVPNAKVGAFLGEGGSEQQRLITECGLTQLQFGNDADGICGERLLHAVGDRDAIQNLFDEALILLGVSPSGYASHPEKRKRDDSEDASEVPAGHGKYSAHVRSKDMRRTPGTSRNTQTARKKSTKS